ncbi:hypothetical protein VDGL01_08459 [Verticillium dahliae]
MQSQNSDAASTVVQQELVAVSPCKGGELMRIDLSQGRSLMRNNRRIVPTIPDATATNLHERLPAPFIASTDPLPNFAPASYSWPAVGGVLFLPHTLANAVQRPLHSDAAMSPGFSFPQTTVCLLAPVFIVQPHNALTLSSPPTTSAEALTGAVPSAVIPSEALAPHARVAAARLTCAVLLLG